jgi:hypothetical protein
MTNLRYFKRHRMELDLRHPRPQPELPRGFYWQPWAMELLELHARVKFNCFMGETDAEVFPYAFKQLRLGKVVGVPTAGGVIGTIRRDGALVETGPNSTRTTPSLEKLIDTLGIRGERIDARTQAEIDGKDEVEVLP